MPATPDHLHLATADGTLYPVSVADPLGAGGSATLVAAGEVHVWQCTTGITTAAMTRLEELLTADERARAGRFSLASDRARFVVGRGTLRAVLATQIGVEAPAIEILLGPNGRPELGAKHSSSQLRFNVSHSGESVVVAFANAIDVGIDIEDQRVDRPLARIARRVFGPREREMLEAAGDSFVPTFYSIWTLREAFVKALGDGLTGWSGIDIAHGPSGALSAENVSSPWLALLIPGRGAIALSARPHLVKSWAV